MRWHKFLRDWSLPIAMLGGVVMYLLYSNIPLFDGTHDFVSSVISFVQPGLIFAMLFVTFCKVKVKEFVFIVEIEDLGGAKRLESIAPVRSITKI